MNVLICDDEKATCAALESTILKYSQYKSVKLPVEVFYSGAKLIEYLSRGYGPDILFLDIEMPELDGISVGSYIRDTLHNEEMCIVYISSNTQYALQLFKNRPFDFLVKPLKEENIYEVLDHIVRVMGKESRFFNYQKSKVFYRVSYADILYFQSAGKKIDIVMHQERREFYGKMVDVEKELPLQLFLSIHKSFLVNYNYVQEYNYDSVKMVNGDVLSISKSKRSLVRKSILEREKYGTISI